jgi:hypothetical protein
VVVCCSSRTASPPELPELNVCNMQDPFTKVSQRLQVVRENHKFDLSSGLCPVHHLSAMEPPCSSTYHIPDDVYLLENCPIRDSSIIESHLWLSQRITVVFIMCTNSSLKSFSNQTASQKAILSAMYSALVVLRVTDVCFLLIQGIEADSKEKEHLKVL